jgi:hypothetical protein
MLPTSPTWLALTQNWQGIQGVAACCCRALLTLPACLSKQERACWHKVAETLDLQSQSTVSILYCCAPRQLVTPDQAVRLPVQHSPPGEGQSP